jgi:LysM repeat protein
LDPAVTSCTNASNRTIGATASIQVVKGIGMSIRIRACLVSVICLIGLGAGISTDQVGAATGQSYVVRANDTLSAIALRERISQAELVRLNGIADPNRLLVGQTLILSENGTTGPGITGQDGSATYSPAGAGQVWSNGRHTRVDAYSRGAYGYSAPNQSVAGTYQTQTTGYNSADLSSTDSASTQGAGYVGSETGMTYIVQPGDTLGALGTRFGVSVSALSLLNGIDRPELLQAGRRLEIPAAATTDSTIGTAATYNTPIASPTPVSTVFTTAAEQSVMPDLPVATVTPTASTTGGVTTSGSGADTSQGTIETILTAEAAAYGVDPALVKAVAWQESGWRMVTAADGGIGVMQLMPATATWVGPALLGRAINPNNVQDNIQAGVALLASYLHTYGGNVREALGAYNAGPGNIANGIPSSTQQYINDVLSLQAGYAQ